MSSGVRSWGNGLNYSRNNFLAAPDKQLMDDDSVLEALLIEFIARVVAMGGDRSTALYAIASLYRS